MLKINIIPRNTIYLEDHRVPYILSSIVDMYNFFGSHRSLDLNQTEVHAIF